MIYASDLDRTLIYSQSFIDLHPTSARLILVDRSTVNSYIAKDVAIALMDVVEKGVKFIPVTTRSITEYKRINFPFEHPEYAITTYGGKILHNGKILNDWEKELEGKRNIDELQELCKELDKLDSIKYISKIIDSSYVFSKSSDMQKTKEELAVLQLKYPHYKVCLDKHKVYAIPNYLGKDKALKWIMQYIGVDKVVASGDSSFDIPMISMADIAVVPSHRYIKDLELENIDYIEVSGEVLSPLETLKLIENELNCY